MSPSDDRFRLTQDEYKVPNFFSHFGRYRRTAIRTGWYKQGIKAEQSMAGSERREGSDRSSTSNALSQLEVTSSSLGLDESVKEEAKHVFQRAVEDGLFRGTSSLTIAAVSIYTACRERSIRVNLGELVRTIHSNVSIRIIRKYYSFLVQKLNIEIPDAITDTDNCLLRIALKSGKSEESVNLARKIIDIADKSGNATAGRHPTAVAAAALYLACIRFSENVTEEDVSNAADVTPAALRHSLKFLRKSFV